jgi:hypothetical protein
VPEPEDKIYAKYQVNGHEKIAFPIPPYEITMQVADGFNSGAIKDEWIKVYKDGFDVTSGFLKAEKNGVNVRPTTDNLYQLIDLIKMNVEGGAA